MSCGTWVAWLPTATARAAASRTAVRPGPSSMRRGAHAVSHDQPAPYLVTPPLDHREIYDPGDRISFSLTLIGKGRDLVALGCRRDGAIGQRHGLGVFRSPWRLSSLSAEGPPGTRTPLDPERNCGARPSPS